MFICKLTRSLIGYFQIGLDSIKMKLEYYLVLVVCTLVVLFFCLRQL